MLQFLISYIVPIAILLVVIIIPIMFRRVVSTNTVHIVQSRKKTTPYGTSLAAGNVYYKWPSWIPVFGVTVIALPVSNFDLSLKDYEAYDQDRVPFKVDVTAFFRIEDTAIAAQRVTNVKEMEAQLLLIVQGAVRKVLASDQIDSIMLERAKFGNDFTKEVEEQLKEWGVKSVKSMELMDIRDGHDSKVISNIMAKKKSHIEMESRVEVAKNEMEAETAEVDATKAVDIRKQEAEEAVGKRTAEKDKSVGIANEESKQEILKQEKVTKEDSMAVKRVEQVKTAEITKDEQIVIAEQEKKTIVILAEGNLEAKRKEAAGIEVIGDAKASAEKAIQLAPVEAQIVLAKEIGSNDGYQKFLMTVEAIKAHLVVGTEQAKALQAADIKVIANAGSPSQGVTNVMELFSSKGGTELSSMVEAFAQTPMGEAALLALGIKTDKPLSPKVEEKPESNTSSPKVEEKPEGDGLSTEDEDKSETES